MADSMEAVSFLVGSSNRVAVLEELRSGRRSTNELDSIVGVPRVTLWRVLRDLGERGWIHEEDGTYVLSNEGRLIYDDFEALLSTVEAAAALGDFVEYLPLDDLGFDVHRLAEATLVVPSPSDPQGPIRVAERQVREARTVRILSHALAPGVLDVLHDRSGSGDLSSLDAVVTAEVVDAISIDPASRSTLGELVATDDVNVFRYDGEIPHLMAILDDERVGLAVDDEHGAPKGVVETDDEVVLDWARETVDDYRESAERIDPSDFTA